MDNFTLNEMIDYFCNEIMAQWGRGFDKDDTIYADIRYKNADEKDSNKKFKTVITEDREGIKKQITEHCENICATEGICFDDITDISLFVCD